MTRNLLRRSVALAAVCLVGLSGLTACQTQAGVAAFVGTQRITEDTVRKLSDDGLAVRSISQQVGGNVAGYRQLILSRLVRRELIDGAARKLRVSASNGDLDQNVTGTTKQFGGQKQIDEALAQLRLPPGELRPFLRELLLMQKIGEKLTEGTTFTDAELKKYYDEHGGSANGPFEPLKAEIAKILLQPQAAQKAQDYVDKYLSSVRLKVNPRYGRLDRSKLFDRQNSSIAPAPDALVRDVPVKVTPSPST
ncbi:MAG: SurA N-terminal domain-containing protein [Actinomycetota bacterium]|nr:SurA N-terminal domain-containing protein [Actinomycetota bacterium]